MNKLIFAGMLCFLPALWLPAAVTYHVSPAGNETDYTTWAGAATNIQDAINVAVNGDTVLVTNNATYNLDTYLVVNAGIRLLSYGSGGELDPDSTIIDGQGVTRGIYINNADALVAGFTFTNGVAEDPDPSPTQHATVHDWGGGVYLNAGTLSNCVVIGNMAKARGGGVYATGADSLVVDCRIIGNTMPEYSVYHSYHGGAGALVNAGAVIEGSTLADNETWIRGGGGGGLRLSSAVARDCVIVGNGAFGGLAGGGGVMIVGTGSLLIDSSVSNNVQRNSQARSGGGVYVAGGNRCDRHQCVRDAWIVNCMISSNSGESTGGISLYAVEAEDGAIITNSRVLNNEVVAGSPTGTEGAAGIGQPGAESGTFEIYDTIVASNYAVIAGARSGGVNLLRGAVIERCEIRDNHGWLYGGLNISTAGSGISRVRNTLIAGNRNDDSFYSATRSAGLTIPGDTFVENCTIVSNVASHASASGGLLFNSEGGTVSNTIVMYNIHPSASNWVARTDVTPRFAYGCTMPTNDLVGAGNIEADPLFADADFRLSRESPSINKGMNQDWMLEPGATDLDGRARIDPFSGRVDMGCYEYLPRGTLFRTR